MTIVCGYFDGTGRVWIGSDSRSSFGHFVFPERARKIWRVGGWLVGASGCDRVHEIVREAAGGVGGIVELRDWVMGAVKEAGWASEDEHRRGEPPVYSFSLLAARVGCLWGVAGDGSIWEPAWGFGAIGSGQDFAYGAAHAIMNFRSAITGDRLVRAAVRAAIEFRSDCGGDVVVESI